MNRLESIKERLDKVTHLRGNKGFDAREEFESCAEADIDYLLSKLEIAQKALEEELKDAKTWENRGTIKRIESSLNQLKE